MLMLLSRLIWPKKIFYFINKCSFKSSPRSAYYDTVTPYDSDEVLFRPPCSANSQNTILAKQRIEPLQEHAAAWLV